MAKIDVKTVDLYLDQFKNIDQDQAKKFIKYYNKSFQDFGFNWDNFKYFKNEYGEQVMELSPTLELAALDFNYFDFNSKTKNLLLKIIKKCLELATKLGFDNYRYEFEKKKLWMTKNQGRFEYRIALKLTKPLNETTCKEIVNCYEKDLKIYLENSLYENDDLFAKNNYDHIVIVYDQATKQAKINLYNGIEQITSYTIDAIVLDAYYNLNRKEN